MFSKKQRPFVGLDIGSSTVKVVEIRDDGEEKRLVKYGVSEPITEAVVDGEIVDRDLVAHVIKDLFSREHISPRCVVSSVSGRAVMVKKITMDRLSPEDASEAVLWEAEQHLPFEIADVALDYQILDSNTDPKLMDVLLVAAKREMIQAHTELIRQAGLTPLLIDVDYFAIQNALEANYDLAEEQTIGLVNVGSELTNINVFTAGVPLLTKDLSVGVKNFVETFQKRHSIEENHKAAAAIKGEWSEPQEVVDVVREVAEDVATALERSFAYLRTSGEADSADRLLVSGGGAKLPGLVDFLAERFNAEVEVANPLRKIAYDESLFEEGPVEDLAPVLTVGVGLALRDN
jgi:type IV pilus assembly protein PilM